MDGQAHRTRNEDGASLAEEQYSDGTENGAQAHDIADGHGGNEVSPRTSFQSDILLSQLLERELAEGVSGPPQDADMAVRLITYAVTPGPVSPLTPTAVPTEQDPTANTFGHEGAALLPEPSASEGVGVSSETLEPLEKTENPPPEDRTRPVHARIGTYTLVLAIIATVFLWAPLAFLGWMWFGNRSSSIWRRLMLDDYAKQGVTISALVLRTALACLGGIATAMIASVSIEHRGVPFQDVAEVSIARFTNSGPDVFWISMLFRKTFVEIPARLLLILLLLITLASQFTSTILLSDLGQGTVITPSTTSANTSGFSYAGATVDSGTGDTTDTKSPFLTSPNYFTTDPTVFQTFAEHSEPGKSSDGVDDTGLTLRAFLPFADTTARQSIGDFQGTAPVFDTRVVCTRPNITSLTNDLTRSLAASVFLGGNITTNPSLPGLAATEPVISFSCPQTLNSFTTNVSASANSGTYWSVCPLDASAGGLLPVLDPAVNASLRLVYANGSMGDGEYTKVNPRGGRWHVADDGWFVDIGNAYLIHNAANFNQCDWASFTWSSVPSEGPWVDVNLQPTAKAVGYSCEPTNVRMSLCYDALSMPLTYNHIQDFNVTASAATARTEPSLQYDLEQRLFSTDSIRTQLGATTAKASLTERGILNLTSAGEILAEVANLTNFWQITTESDLDLFDPTMAGVNVFNWSTYQWIAPMVFYSLQTSNDSVQLPLAMCLGCTNGATYLTQASTIAATLFSDTIATTNSPALALQAVWTTMLRMAYYSFLPTFDAESNITVTSFRAAQIPLRTRGFFAVLAITSAHFVLCLVALMGFVSFTRVSSLKNAWQVIADVSQNPEMAGILHNVGGRSDGEVAELVEKDENLINRRFRVLSFTNSTEE